MTTNIFRVIPGPQARMLSTIRIDSYQQMPSGDLTPKLTLTLDSNVLQSITVTASFSGTGTASLYEFSFGDGTIVRTTLATVSHQYSEIYTNADVYVKVRACYNEYGMMDEWSAPLRVSIGEGIRVAPIVASLPPGDYSGVTNITLTSATVNATLLYSLDGSAPSTPAANGATISLTDSTRIRAIAQANGLQDSAEFDGQYNIVLPLADAPYTFQNPGVYNQTLTVTIYMTPNMVGAGGLIYYTLDGTQPDENSNQSTSPLVLNINETTTVRAFVTSPSHRPSGQLAVLYNIQLTALPPPTANPTQGTYNVPQFVVLSALFSGSTIYYTVDGTTPTAFAPTRVYTTPIPINVSTVIKAFVRRAGYSDSAIVSFTYDIVAATGATAAPNIYPASGTYSGQQAITMTCATPNSVIHYTTDGSTPTKASPMYTVSFMLRAPATIKAIAIAGGLTESSISTAAYVVPITPPEQGPQIYSYDNYIIDSTHAKHIYGVNLDTVTSVAIIDTSGSYNVAPPTATGIHLSYQVPANWIANGDESATLELTWYDTYNGTYETVSVTIYKALPAFRVLWDYTDGVATTCGVEIRSLLPDAKINYADVQVFKINGVDLKPFISQIDNRILASGVPASAMSTTQYNFWELTLATGEILVSMNYPVVGAEPYLISSAPDAFTIDTTLGGSSPALPIPLSAKVDVAGVVTTIESNVPGLWTFRFTPALVAGFRQLDVLLRQTTVGFVQYAESNVRISFVSTISTPPIMPPPDTAEF